MCAVSEKSTSDQSRYGRPPRIYVAGHRNPDMDSIAAAIGYAELKSRLDGDNIYEPVRLGEVNAQTAWCLERSEAQKPELLRHIKLRVRDVMKIDFEKMDCQTPVRQVGMAMAADDLDMVPLVNDAGELAGIMTERALARRYIRETRETSTLVDAPTSVAAICKVLDGRVVAGSEEGEIAGRVWVHSIDPQNKQSRIEEGDVVVTGDRADAQLQAIERGAALVVASNGSEPSQEVLDAATEGGTTVMLSRLDSYVTSRMITLSAPAIALAEKEPLTVNPDDLISEIEGDIKDVHYRAAVAVDSENKPVGLITRSDLVSPEQRRAILVDHSEPNQSIEGLDEAEVVEILDHHHISSFETRKPILAVFDPVGSTATLILERFKAEGLEPERSTTMMLLGAIMSDTVVLNSPTKTERDEKIVEWVEELLEIDAREFGEAMFEASSDVSNVSATDIVGRDSKEYEVSGGEKIFIAQIETTGKSLLERQEELEDALEKERSQNGYALGALMVTDILEQGTHLLACGDVGAVEKALGKRNDQGRIPLPGVMSRKKQVAPELLEAL